MFLLARPLRGLASRPAPYAYDKAFTVWDFWVSFLNIDDKVMGLGGWVNFCLCSATAGLAKSGLFCLNKS
ncbi:hypothetical protein KKH59_03380 [Patescibacteria group bacterium]|nr:hypothetical protein [Patescibacteria group bacterium]